MSFAQPSLVLGTSVAIGTSDPVISDYKGFDSWSAIADTNQVYYTIRNNPPDGVEEQGLGTKTTVGGKPVLQRTAGNVIKGSSGVGVKVNFTAQNQFVYISELGEVKVDPNVTSDPTVLVTGQRWFRTDLAQFRGNAGTPTSFATTSSVDVAAMATGGSGTAGNPWTGWDTAITWSANTEYRFRSGTYSYATSPNYLQSGIALVGEAGTILKHTGSGNAVIFDNPASFGFNDARNWTMNVRMQNFLIRGNASTVHGLFLRGVRNGLFQHIGVGDVATDALRLEACVTNTFHNFRCTKFEETGYAFTVVPTNGIHLTSRAADGNQSAESTFVNPVIEGTSSIGVWIEHSWYDLFMGGTIANSGNYGVKTDVDSRHATFVRVDVEQNTGQDIFQNGGQGITLVNCFSAGTCEFSGQYITLIGGWYTNITLDATAAAEFASVYLAGTLTDNSTVSTFRNTFDTAGAHNIADRLGKLTYKNFTRSVPGATYTPDIQNGQYFMHTLQFLGQNLTIANPATTPTDTQLILFRIIQDGTGGKQISWGTQYHGYIPQNSLAANATDYYAFQYQNYHGYWDLIWSSIGTAGGVSGNVDAMTYAGTITLNPTLAPLHTTTTVNATGNATINASTAGLAGQRMWLIITNDATSGKTITFGTNFRPTGTLVGTVSKAATIHFVSDGSNWYEVSRSLVL